MDYVNMQIIKESHITEIMKYLHEGIVIPEDMMYAFYLNTMAVARGTISKSSISERAKDFCLYMSHLWSSKSYVKLNCDSTFIFQLGELHACARILEDYFAKINEENDIEINSRIETDSKRFNTKLSFFETVMRNPGIKHTKLSEEMGISKSSLSQFVARIKEYGYYSERIAGREKYYYLTETGKKLLKRMHEEINKTIRKEYDTPAQNLTRLIASNSHANNNSSTTLRAEGIYDLIYFNRQSNKESNIPEKYEQQKKDVISLFDDDENTYSSEALDDSVDKFIEISDLNSSVSQLYKYALSADQKQLEFSYD